MAIAAMWSHVNRNDQGSSSVRVKDDAYSDAGDAVAVVEDTLEEEPPYSVSGWYGAVADAYSSSDNVPDYG
jgi:hypothetical protein